MGPQGSGGTLNCCVSAEVILKTSVPNEPGINLVLWYRLVGCMSFYFHLSVKASGLQWYVTDRSHLGAVSFALNRQGG